MKNRFLYIATALALTVSLTACGGADTPAETPAPTETPVPTALPQPSLEPVSGSDISLPEVIDRSLPKTAEVTKDTAFPLIMADGGTVKADLDGDGTAEEVSVSAYKEGRDIWLLGSLTVNGTELVDELYALGYSGYSPDSGCFAITDLTPGDGKLEIALQDLGASDDYTTTFLRWDGDKLSVLGTVEGLVYSVYSDCGDISFDGKGGLTTYMRLKNLQTWYADVTWTEENGRLCVEEQDVYPSRGENAADTLVPMTLYASKDLSSAKTDVPAGETLVFKGSDNGEWVLVSCKDKDLWLHLASGYAVESGDELVYSWDAFDGLILAD